MAEILKPRACSACPAYYEPCLPSGGGPNPAHLIVVGQSPSGFSIGKRTPFFGANGRLFKQLIDMIKKYADGRYAAVRCYTTYATLVGAYNPSAKHLKSCQPNLFREINMVRGLDREPVVVPLGPVAARAVGLKFGKIADIVGRELSITVAHPNGMRRLPVVPLLSMPHLNTKVGTAGIVLEGLLRAVRLAMDPPVVKRSLDELSRGYTFPKSIPELRALIDNVIAYYNPERGSGPTTWTITLDTETNTLRPFAHPDPRVLMLSVAWDVGRSAAILLDHPEAPYPPAEAWAEVKRLLECPKPKVWHNWKFDLKFLEILHGIRVTNVAGDTMLWEHYGDEDKKGHYGLKRLTPIYAPEYEGYDEKLQSVLRGREEDAEKDDSEKEDGAAGEETEVEMTPLTLSDDAILEYHLTNGCPDDRDDALWSTLVLALRAKAPLDEIKPKKRTDADRTKLTALKDEIVALRKELQIAAKPKKPRKAKRTGADGEDGAEGVDHGFEKVELSDLMVYAATDADVTRIILRSQLGRLHAYNRLEVGTEVMNNLYLPGSRTLGRMEYRGIAVDLPYLNGMYTEVEKRMKEAEATLHREFDPTLNLNSPIQIKTLMGTLNFESLPGEDAESTGKDQLDKYAARYAEGDPRHLFVTKLREYRETHKTLNTYIRPIRRYSRYDGKIHCQFHLNGTATGRLSSSRMNMQNIIYIAARRTAKGPDGKEIILHPGYNIKKCFIPSTPGYKMVNIDIKGAELRVYTVYSKDALMIDALSKGLDVHSYVTSKVYGIPYEEVQAKKETDPTIKTLRTNCKRVVFGTFYGAGPYKISQQIGSTVEEAQKVQEDIFNAFPAIREYVDNVSRQVHDRQMVESIFGRCRRFRMAHVSKKLMGDACREAVNFLIQSTSSDLVLSQLCEVDDHIGEIGGRLLITVHDSITLELPAENVDKIFDFMDHWIVERVHERFPWLPVDFLYDVEVGDSYGEMKPIKRQKPVRDDKETAA